MPGWQEASWHPPDAHACAQVEALHNLSYQLRQITHHEPFDHEKLAAKGEWLDAPDLITLVEREKHGAIQQLQVTCRRQVTRRLPLPPAVAGTMPACGSL